MREKTKNEIYQENKQLIEAYLGGDPKIKKTSVPTALIRIFIVTQGYDKDFKALSKEAKIHIKEAIQIHNQLQEKGFVATKEEIFIINDHIAQLRKHYRSLFIEHEKEQKTKKGFCNIL